MHAPVSACASGAEAIRWGLDLLRFDRADVVLVGGTEACVHPLPMAGFAAMRAMSTRNDEPERASRPFDKGRDGFVLGEGAACIVLERGDAARARGARIHARLAGAAGTADGYDLVAPHPEGEGAARAITRRAPRRRPQPRPTSSTSTRTPPRPRSATPPRPRRSARRSAST